MSKKYKAIVKQTIHGWETDLYQKVSILGLFNYWKWKGGIKAVSESLWIVIDETLENWVSVLGDKVEIIDERPEKQHI